MKTFVIHLGIGRTGTTYLNKIFFEKLSNNNIINYIKTNTKEYKEFSNIIKIENKQKYECEKNKILKILNYSTNKINLISDETLLPNQNSQISFDIFYHRINEIFENPKIIITLREQVSAIKSYYLSNNKYIQENKFLSFEKFLFDFVYHSHKYKYFGILKYKNLLQYFSDKNNNLYLFLYEDLKMNPSKYFDEWLSILEVKDYRIAVNSYNFNINNTTAFIYHYRKLLYSFRIFKIVHFILVNIFKVLRLNFNDFISNIKGKTKVIIIKEKHKELINKIFAEDNRFVEEKFKKNLKKYKYKI